MNCCITGQIHCICELFQTVSSVAMTYKIVKETKSKWLHEIFIASRNTPTYKIKINLPQRLHSHMEPINESTCFTMSASINQKAEVDLFCLFQRGLRHHNLKQQETVLPRFSHSKVDSILYMWMHPQHPSSLLFVTLKSCSLQLSVCILWDTFLPNSITWPVTKYGIMLQMVKKRMTINSNDNDFRGMWTVNDFLSSNKSDFWGSVNSSAFSPQERPPRVMVAQGLLEQRATLHRWNLLLEDSTGPASSWSRKNLKFGLWSLNANSHHSGEILQ